MSFNTFGLNNNILEALADLNYTEATPIQNQIIPKIMEGKDVVGCAQTGTGKTAAFAVPISNLIHRIVGSPKKRKQIRTVVLSPTRELAVQIAEDFEAVTKFTAIKTLVIYGGISQDHQVDELKKGVDVLVATPGRFLDLYKQNHIDIDHVHQLVIDEADLMLDMGFIDDVRKVVKLCPDNRQTLLFSATMPFTIRELAEEFLSQPEYVLVNPVSSTAEKVKQQVYFVEKEEKKNLLIHVLKEKSWDDVLIFTRTKHGADKISELLNDNGFKASSFHGNKSQHQRIQILEQFKQKKISVLVATDVASRGIDIHQLPFVINYDIPNISENYVHRIGRTGRAGNEGVAISFVGKDEKNYWTDIEKLIRKQVKVIANHPYAWKENDPNTKKDYRNKRQTNTNRNSKNSNGRKSEASKKNKRRWY